MKKYLLVLVGLVVLARESAHAATFVTIMTPPQLLNLTVLGLAAACAVGSFRVLTLVRGGMLAKSWQLFLAAFVVLAFAQVLAIFNAIDLMATPAFLVPFMYGSMAGLFLYGIFETRRTLS